MQGAMKVCVVCGQDVASRKRVKDQQGHYYCEPCHQKKTAPVAAAPRPQPVPQPVAAAVAAPADDGMLDLAPIATEKPRSESMAACSSCKKVLPERQVRMVDGEFVCNACFARRHQRGPKVAAVGAPVAKPLPRDRTETSDELSWSQTLGGSAVISLIALVAAFFVSFGVMTFWPDPDYPTTAARLLVAAIDAFRILVQGAGLIASMAIAARLMGGISFGYIGPVVYKALFFFTGLMVFDYFTTSYFFVGIGLKFVLIACAFMVLYKLDGFEAWLLAIINTALSWVILFVFIMLAISLAAVGHHGSDDEEFGDNPKMVAPDEDEEMPVPPAAPTPQTAPANPSPDAAEPAPAPPEAAPAQ